jgi:ribosomal protein S27AE
MNKKERGRANPLPLAERCQRCGAERRKFFVIIRAAVQMDSQLCTRCTNIILAKHPASEAVQMIETKKGAN